MSSAADCILATLKRRSVVTGRKLISETVLCEKAKIVFWAPGRIVDCGRDKVGTCGHRRWEVFPGPAVVASIASLSATSW